jgi:hypothetical protein
MLTKDLFRDSTRAEREDWTAWSGGWVAIDTP